MDVDKKAEVAGKSLEPWGERKPEGKPRSYEVFLTTTKDWDLLPK